MGTLFRRRAQPRIYHRRNDRQLAEPSIKLVGVVLVSALLVIPAATGQIAARSMTGMLTISIAVALVAVVFGLWLSWISNLPSGATIVLPASALFLVALVARRR
jgi:ABC-type Mn2+/Zn2+ transport system permease subunit